LLGIVGRVHDSTEHLALAREPRDERWHRPNVQSAGPNRAFNRPERAAHEEVRNGAPGVMSSGLPAN
jgi:hypothetical protein